MKNRKQAPDKMKGRGKVANFFRKKASDGENRAEENVSEPQESVDAAVQPVVGSEVTAPSETEQHAQPIPAAPTGVKKMILRYKGLSKNGRAAFYGGAVSPLRIQVGVFPGKKAPETISVDDGVFATKPVKEAKVKLTKEQRAALPKPTLAEKIARREAALARDKAKLAAANASL